MTSKPIQILASGTAAILITTAPVLAAGIERSTQSIGILFEEGNYVEFNAQLTSPDVTGKDVLGYPTKNVADDFNTVGIGYKHQFNEQLSGALIVEHPYGADIAYPTAAEGGSAMLGGTKASVESAHISGILRYKFNDSWAVHGGLRVTKASADVTLDGLAYGGAPPTGVSSYRAKLQDSTQAGWLAGFSWERPDIAARVALTYYSEIEHEFDTEERFGAMTVAKGTTKVKTPKQIALDFQTGVAPGTLVFGQIRRVYWNDFRVDPAYFVGVTGDGLVELENATTYTLGVGRQFTQNWAGSASITYEPEGDELVSPLAPSNGKVGLTLAGTYTQANWKITGGINYTKLGDAKPETGTPDTARAEMTDNDALSLGLRIGYRF
ncbi:OmpP1/FadL family transporter [Paracoccus sp. SCSIO 75233]|uniref:OmpP1/FadL family transporter n=1 Tax=Paracoccus sp. SCSIO 75233 TaxID=3017782 RepID=UPI0022EFFCF3|nr:outer membrane protein transport protein [Paracoccus sp. SCSIO 75233]WBU52536.1 outer membrane protein transport protein [Paracoccus sp. SCSIO 75233]